VWQPVSRRRRFLRRLRAPPRRDAGGARYRQRAPRRLAVERLLVLFHDGRGRRGPRVLRPLPRRLDLQLLKRRARARRRARIAGGRAGARIAGGRGAATPSRRGSWRRSGRGRPFLILPRGRLRRRPHSRPPRAFPSRAGARGGRRWGRRGGRSAPPFPAPAPPPVYGDGWAGRCRPDPRRARGLRSPGPPGGVVRIGKIRKGPFLILPMRDVPPGPPAARRAASPPPAARLPRRPPRGFPAARPGDSGLRDQAREEELGIAGGPRRRSPEACPGSRVHRERGDAPPAGPRGVGRSARRGNSGAPGRSPGDEVAGEGLEAGAAGSGDAAYPHPRPHSRAAPGILDLAAERPCLAVACRPASAHPPAPFGRQRVAGAADRLRSWWHCPISFPGGFATRGGWK